MSMKKTHKTGCRLHLNFEKYGIIFETKFWQKRFVYFYSNLKMKNFRDFKFSEFYEKLICNQMNNDEYK